MSDPCPHLELAITVNTTHISLYGTNLSAPTAPRQLPATTFRLACANCGIRFQLLRILGPDGHDTLMLNEERSS